MYKQGDKVKVKITSTVTYGAFCEVVDSDPLVRGLIHISEISSLYVSNIEDYFKVGDVVECEVISFLPEKNQLNLSYKKIHDGKNEASTNALPETGTGFKNLKKSTVDKVKKN
ncbi:S1 RNA-binding domain-containing protein [Spiroplasma endosymbiont of Labia minor]|uniref:S1 RNA-binding domain-containing protein n=1 Tax=Spiroplasma endosymbiont of Labia minor TaxID=3066305 RepID=UPI0030D53629